ncbi:MAG: hypothetical protein ACK4OG_14370, partial [Parvibaculum sp.]
QSIPVVLHIFAMFDKAPDLPRMVLRGSRRTPYRELAELTAPACLVIPGTAQITETMASSLHEAPPCFLGKANGLLDLLMRMPPSSGHSSSLRIGNHKLVVK